MEEKPELIYKDEPIISVDCPGTKKPTSYRCRCGELVYDEHDSVCDACGQRYEWQNSPLADKRIKREKARAVDAQAKKDPAIVKVEAIALSYVQTTPLNMFGFGNDTKHTRGRLDPTGDGLVALALKIQKADNGKTGITAQGFLARLKGLYNKYGPAAVDFIAQEQPAAQASWQEGALANDNLRPS